MGRVIVILLIVLLACFAIAQTGAQTDILQTGRLNESTAGNATAEGGNVTMINLTAVASTTRWQGFYGNVSGALSLGIGSDVFYDFSAATVANVYVSQNLSFDFSVLEAGTAADVDTRWGYATGADMATNIFTETSVISGISAPSTELEPTGSNYNTTILDCGTSVSKLSFAFGVSAQEPAVTCFDGTDCEYELMVPSDGQEVYYFFLEI